MSFSFVPTICFRLISKRHSWDLSRERTLFQSCTPWWSPFSDSQWRRWWKPDQPRGFARASNPCQDSAKVRRCQAWWSPFACWRYCCSDSWCCCLSRYCYCYCCCRCCRCCDYGGRWPLEVVSCCCSCRSPSGSETCVRLSPWSLFVSLSAPGASFSSAVPEVCRSLRRLT